MRILALIAAVLVAGVLSLLVARPAGTDGEPATGEVVQAPQPAPVNVIVRFRAGADSADRAAARRGAGTDFERSLPLSGVQLVDPDPGVSARQAAARLERSDDVVYAEPDFARAAAAVPNDTYFEYLWGLNNTGQSINGSGGSADADVDGPEAWELTTGSSAVTVGVIDSGVDYAHPDLAPNIWRNGGETGASKESNGIDDDSNGLVDDTRGWDWVERDNAPSDGNGHGTHVAGTIGARGNDGTGVTGVAWQVGLAPLRVLNAEGSGRVSDLIAAYAYAARKGMPVVNASLGGSDFSQAERDAIAAAPGTLFVVAAGNDGSDNDATGSYPCNYPLANVVCVAATDNRDALASFSNFGDTTVDLAAPGVDIASTYPGSDWVYLSGTSMATPHVAGAAALVLARSQGATPADLRAALLQNLDPLPALAGKTVTGGRLNVRRAVAGASGDGAAAAAPSQPQTEAPSAGNDAPITAAPAPAPAIAPGASDSTAPAVSARVAATRRLAALLRSGLRTRLGCSERCSLRAQLVVGRAAARRLRLGSGSRSVVVGSLRTGLSARGSRLVSVRLTARARRALARVRSAGLELRVRGSDRAGNAKALRRSLRFRR